MNLELGEVYQDHVRSAARQAAGQTVFLGNCLMALRYVLRRGGTGYFPEYVIRDHLRDNYLIPVPGAVDLMLPLFLITRRGSAASEDILACLIDLRAIS